MAGSAICYNLSQNFNPYLHKTFEEIPIFVNVESSLWKEGVMLSTVNFVSDCGEKRHVVKTIFFLLTSLQTVQLDFFSSCLKVQFKKLWLLFRCHSHRLPLQAVYVPSREWALLPFARIRSSLSTDRLLEVTLFFNCRSVIVVGK